MSDILFLAHRAPYPPDRGDRIRSYHVLRHLAARARVHLIAFVDEPIDMSPLQAVTASCTIVPRRKRRARATLEALATGRPVSLTAFDDPAMRTAVAAAPRADAIYAFSGQMAQYLPAQGPRVVMDFVDVDSAKFAAMAEAAAPPLRPMLRREARLLGAFERAVAARADASLFVTAAEAELFRRGGGEGRIAVVENGIDAARFAPDAAFARVADAGPLIVFTGQMDYLPNVNAVAWFAREVLPPVRRVRPDARFAIVGRAPTAAVRGLARLPGVVVTGAVSDVRGWLAAAAVCVAPLRLARGVQNKVLEAMAMARPVIASPAAAEGIDHGGTVTVADGAERWAEVVSTALADPAAAEVQGAAACARVAARYAWPARLAPLDALLGLDQPTRAAA
ncbi:TIGR03087 family PEP-CTERM/XrtA system glycosyltransferase [uncultured Sphingomonas sp.]|uniref:TIGR03087 family PEP-CTERM/XrtA system glycosyltransferase n=1 Tax=uncultured Sphingomonas sp. TaxID=158754 RepID=UPI0035CC3104